MKKKTWIVIILVCLSILLSEFLTFKNTTHFNDYQIDVIDKIDLHSYVEASEIKPLENQSIEILDYYEGELIFTIDDSSDNQYIFETKGIYSFDIEQKKICCLKQMLDNIRVWDVRFRNNVLYYTTVEEKDGLLNTKVYKEINNKPILIDEGYIFQVQNVPSFAIMEDNIYYIKKSMNLESNKMSTTFNKIVNNSFETLFDLQNTFDDSYYISKKQANLQFTEISSSEKLLAFFYQKENNGILCYFYNNHFNEVQIDDVYIQDVSALDNYILIRYFDDLKDNTLKYKLYNIHDKSIHNTDITSNIARDKIIATDTLISTNNEHIEIIQVDNNLTHISIIDNTEYKFISPVYFITKDNTVLYLDVLENYKTIYVLSPSIKNSNK